MAHAQTGTGAAPASPAVAPAPKVHVKFTRDQLAGRLVRARGHIQAGGQERTLLLQVRRHHRWRSVDRARSRHGRFVASWRPHRLGHYRLRVIVKGAVGAQAATSRRTHGTVRVYRRTVASWYGPGLYGGRTACGRTLTAGTLGVANKSLPCGTKVTLRYRGHRVRVPVIDRGPYVGGRTWDLTPATKAKLHFPSTGTVWSTR